MEGFANLACPCCGKEMRVSWKCGHMWDALVELATREAEKALTSVSKAAESE